MNRVQTYSILEEIASADLNTWQDNTLGREQAPGLMLGPPYVYAADATFGLEVTVGPITFMMMDNPNSTLTFAGGTLATTSPTLVAATTYHLFARNNAGVVAFEYVAHASGLPSGGMVFKDGDTARRYITSFRTRPAAAEVIPFYQVGAEYIYRRSLVVSIDDLKVPGITGVDSAGYTTISLAPWMPAHARIAILDVKWRPQATGNSCYLVTDGDTTSDDKAERFEPADLEVVHREIRMITSSAQAIAYKTTGTNTGTSPDFGLEIRVVGYIGNHA
jgi:hypothetical protein